jgi:hypothetical protein
MQHRSIAPILENYSLVVEETVSRKSLRLSHLFELIYLSPFALRLAFRSSRRGLLANSTWFENQLRHATWDNALLGAQDGTTELSLLVRFLSALRVLLKVQYARSLITKHSLAAAFLGHTVYTGRGLLAEFRRQKILIFAHAENVIHRLDPEQDSSCMFMLRHQWDIIFNLVDEVEVKDYWIARNAGRSTYTDAKAAFRKTREVTHDTPKNVLMLHIFRDSPFNYIDTKRVFADYVEWVMTTLVILSKSSETWLIKTHPSADRWGENQHLWLQRISKTAFGGIWPKNLIISDGEYSNVDLFRHAVRFVTFSGTMHLEAACEGVKPIVISEVALHTFDKSFVFKPKTKYEYETLLMAPSSDNQFRLSDSGCLTAMKLLYIREKFLSFGPEVGAFTIYRADSKEYLEKDFQSVSENIGGCMTGLVEAGGALARGLPRTSSLNYMSRWYERYFLN